MRFLLVIFLLLSTPVFAQNFLEKKCQELSNEITDRQKDHDDQQVYLDQLTNAYQECVQDKKSIEDAKEVLQSAQNDQSINDNWSNLDNVVTDNAVNP